ncbi:MAG TPA: energy transducer TonB, partial [Candidatus Eisenbacteria bacterium]|nr:energy transducer TonB [Candidatus Eisenbacteria bacterium]
GRIYEVVDQPPVPVVAPKPAYPRWAIEAGITGRVLLHVLVGEDGRVRKVVVKEGVTGLSEAASEGVLAWVFRPATVRGVAVSTWVSIPVVFRL